MPAFVGRFSGIITYNNGSHQQFAVHMDERGNLSLNCDNTSRQAVLENQNVNVTIGNSLTSHIEAVLALVSSTLVLSPSGTPSRTVTDATVSFTGRIARDNNTWEDFAASYTVKSGAIVQNDSGAGGTSADTDAYDEFPAATVIAWLEGIVGPGNVAVA